ncbi:hypothetical protein FNT36_08990 [Hymenobacter setariae]|uniref:Alpha/beta hydrolase n=1 Tax=Hymenobacter setariae TaxID=2594794 RepID=A0A558BYJ9_9BACT|nr:hypothetical protein [Hymenobacter setariae]TVT41562.1 hypothetical protein FNT36_08990 [Hymenobacter setariae]
MRVFTYTIRCRFGALLVLLAGLAGCQAQPEAASGQAGATHPPTGHFAGTLDVPGQPALRAALEVRHPRPGHYDAELVVPTAPSLSFVADTLDFAQNTLRLARPGRADETLTLTQQGDFWRGALAVDSVTYPVLLLRRGPAEPAVYRVRRDEVAGPSGQALLFSPADETLPGVALAVFPTSDTAPGAPAWADALAREGYTVLLLPAADTLVPPHLTAALAYLRRTPGVDTARVGAWAAGTRAPLLATMLAEATLGGPRPAFVVVQGAPPPTAATRPVWRTLARSGHVLGVYEATDASTVRTAADLRTALANPRTRVLRGQGAGLVEAVVGWLREQQPPR